MSPQSRGRSTIASGGTISPGEHLRAEMERLGLNQVSLGRTLGVTRQTINNIINGRQTISRAMSAGLGRLTSRPPDYWLRSAFGSESSSSVPTLLAKHQILRAIEDGLIGIAPFDKKNLRAASIQLTLGRIESISSLGQGSADSLSLKRGESARVWTRERIDISSQHVGHLGVTPEFAQMGLAAVHHLQIEPGFSGHLSAIVFNAGGGEVVLHIGAPVLACEIVALGVSSD